MTRFRALSAIATLLTLSAGCSEGDNDDNQD